MSDDNDPAPDETEPNPDDEHLGDLLKQHRTPENAPPQQPASTDTPRGPGAGTDSSPPGTSSPDNPASDPNGSASPPSDADPSGYSPGSNAPGSNAPGSPDGASQVENTPSGGEETPGGLSPAADAATASAQAAQADRSVPAAGRRYVEAEDITQKTIYVPDALWRRLSARWRLVETRGQSAGRDLEKHQDFLAAVILAGLENPALLEYLRLGDADPELADIVGVVDTEDSSLDAQHVLAAFRVDDVGSVASE